MHKHVEGFLFCPSRRPGVDADQRGNRAEEEMLLCDLWMRQLINIRALIDRKLLSYRQEATHPNI